MVEKIHNQFDEIAELFCRLSQPDYLSGNFAHCKQSKTTRNYTTGPVHSYELTPIRKKSSQQAKETLHIQVSYCNHQVDSNWNCYLVFYNDELTVVYVFKNNSLELDDYIQLLDQRKTCPDDLTNCISSTVEFINEHLTRWLSLHKTTSIAQSIENIISCRAHINYFKINDCFALFSRELQHIKSINSAFLNIKEAFKYDPDEKEIRTIVGRSRCAADTLATLHIGVTL